MVIASGTSQRHLASMAEHLSEELKSAGIVGVTPEGGSRSDWVLIDGGDIIVHLFRPEVRAFYALEKMWDGELAASSLEGGDLAGDDNGQAVTGWA